MKSRSFKLFMLIIICVLALMNGSNLAFAAAPPDQKYDEAVSVSGTNTVTYNGITYTSNNNSTVQIVECEQLSNYYASAGDLYSGKALANDSNFNMNPTFFQISSMSYGNNFKLNSMYYIASDYGDGYSINIEGLDGGKNGTRVAYAENIDMSASGSYGSGNYIVSLDNKISEPAGGEYGGILTFGSGWNDIDTILITNAAGNTKAVY